MKKILHIFPASTFLGPFVDFINSNFPLEEHVFCVLGDNSKYADLSKYSNVISVLKSEGRVRNARRLISLIRSSEKTIVHGMFSSKLVVLLNIILIFHPGLKRKLFWDIWGGDLYNDLLMPNRSTKARVRNLLKKRVVRSCTGILGQPGDYRIATKVFGASSKNFYVFYPQPVKFLERKGQISDLLELREDVSKTVLLGNSASLTNEHFEAIDKLALISGRFRVLCPLSYGDMEYAKKVSDYGVRKLGERFIPVMEFMTPDKYCSLLSQVDVAVMNHKRQQAFGNIYILLSMGKKIYIRSEISTYEWLNDHLGVKLFDVSNLDNITESELFHFSETLSEANSQIITEFYSEENCVQLWNKVFES